MFKKLFLVALITNICNISAMNYVEDNEQNYRTADNIQYPKDLTSKSIRELYTEIFNKKIKNNWLISDELNQELYDKYNNQPLLNDNRTCYEFAVPYGGLVNLTVYEYIISALVFKIMEEYNKFDNRDGKEEIQKILNCNKISLSNNVKNEIKFLLDDSRSKNKGTYVVTKDNYLAIVHKSYFFTFQPVINSSIGYDELVTDLQYINRDHVDNNSKYFELMCNKRLNAINSLLIDKYDNFTKLINKIENSEIQYEKKISLLKLLLEFYKEQEMISKNCFPLGINENWEISDKLSHNITKNENNELQSLLINKYQEVQKDIRDKLASIKVKHDSGLEEYTNSQIFNKRNSHK